MHIDTDAIISGYPLSRDEALALYEEDLETLLHSAETIRKVSCSGGFDLCAIVNGKNGHCSEDCAFCAQSRRSHAEVATYALMDEEAILNDAKAVEASGVHRYSLVAVGRRLSKREVEQVAAIYRRLKRETTLHLCLSGGLLDREDLTLLKEAGLERVHNNLETSRRYFQEICTTHRYDEKIETIRIARSLGIEVCSGGIIGIGETREDRIDLALTLRELGIRSVPINVLHAIEGTPLEDEAPLTEEEVLRTVAIFRHLLPKATLRLAGGRKNLKNYGEETLRAGINAAITGDFLNTEGADETFDHIMAKRHGFYITPEPVRQ